MVAETKFDNKRAIRRLAQLLWPGRVLSVYRLFLCERAVSLPANNWGIRGRVLLALGLLVGSKILSVQVPYFFKWSVDALTATGVAATPGTLVAAVPLSLLLGCR